MLLHKTPFLTARAGFAVRRQGEFAKRVGSGGGDAVAPVAIPPLPWPRLIRARTTVRGTLNAWLKVTNTSSSSSSPLPLPLTIFFASFVVWECEKYVHMKFILQPAAEWIMAPAHSTPSALADIGVSAIDKRDGVLCGVCVGYERLYHPRGGWCASCYATPPPLTHSLASLASLEHISVRFECMQPPADGYEHFHILMDSRCHGTQSVLKCFPWCPSKSICMCVVRPWISFEQSISLSSAAVRYVSYAGSHPCRSICYGFAHRSFISTFFIFLFRYEFKFWFNSVFGQTRGPRIRSVLAIVKFYFFTERQIMYM